MIWIKTALLMLHLNDVCVAMDITVTSQDLHNGLKEWEVVGKHYLRGKTLSEQFGLLAFMKFINTEEYFSNRIQSL